MGSRELVLATLIPRNFAVNPASRPDVALKSRIPSFK